MDELIPIVFILITVVAIFYCLDMAGANFSWNGGQSLRDNSYFFGKCQYSGFQFAALNIEWTTSRECPDKK